MTVAKAGQSGRKVREKTMPGALLNHSKFASTVQYAMEGTILTVKEYEK